VIQQTGSADKQCLHKISLSVPLNTKFRNFPLMQEHIMNKRAILGALLIAAAVSLTGCATEPTMEAMQAAVANYKLPKMPEPGKAIIYVVRPSSFGGVVRFNVFLDDQEEKSEVGYTRAGQYIYFNVTPGEHKIFSKAENWSDLGITASAGETIFVQQDASRGIVVARNTLFKQEETAGKYHVKTLSLGTIKSDK
jgi:Protein of unknown function (DUF2846)